MFSFPPRPEVSMGFLRNLRIAAKLTIAFAATLLLLGVCFFVQSQNLSRLRQAVEEKTRNTETLLSAAKNVSRGSQLMAIGTLGNLLTGDPAFTGQREAGDELAAESFERALGAASKLPGGDKIAQIASQIQEFDEANCHPLEEKMAELYAAGKKDEAVAIYLNEFRPNRIKLEEMINELVAESEQLSASIRTDAVTQAQRANNVALAVFALAVVLSLGFAAAVSRGITKSINGICTRIGSFIEKDLRSIAEGAEAIAQGDLTYDIESTTDSIRTRQNDEFGQLASMFNSMLESCRGAVHSLNTARAELGRLVGDVKQTSETLGETSEQLLSSAVESAQGSSQIAEGSQSLATQSETMALKMEDLRTTVQSVASGAEQQRTSADQAAGLLEETTDALGAAAASVTTMSETAMAADETVKRTVSTMERVRAQAMESANQVRLLDEKGRQVGDIVQAIRQIAEQTNLLALNAAIEAARAGEHGRGFAVVAEEVRKLAEQSSTSAVEIAELIGGVRETVQDVVASIESTNAEIEEGSRGATETGDALRKIHAAAASVSQAVDTLAAAARSLTARVDDVRSVAEANQLATSGMSDAAFAVADTVSNVASVSQEAAASAQQLEANTAHVSESAQRLSELALELASSVERFQTHDRPTLRLAA
jgi:methyl-accepting chemotaxis protein